MPAGRDGPTDERLLPFLADVTRWLAGGRDLLFAEFGLPTFRRRRSGRRRAQAETRARSSRSRLPRAYTERALVALQRAGCVGAMLWCYSDYESAIWEEAAARPRGPRALVRALASRRLGEARPSPSWRRSQARGDSRAQTDTRGSIANASEFLVDPDVELPRLYGLYRRPSEQG